MNKLINASYKADYLDQKTVNKIVSLISKPDLKKYINGLKLVEKKKNLIISSPIDDQNLKKFEKLFPHKKSSLKRIPYLCWALAL